MGFLCMCETRSINIPTEHPATPKSDQEGISVYAKEARAAYIYCN
uniref:Uncharacterized protein n=1 Tax=Lepeophtheirus salmonis TaxID=72036 RepID=A0A0K2TDH2_LEPSM